MKLSSFLETVNTRGMLHQCTNSGLLDAQSKSGKLIGYIGFDATASSLHVGNLAAIMLLRRLQQSGGKPIILLGGGTTRLCDPSGKDEVRQPLSTEQIARNISSIRACFDRFISFGAGATDAIIVNNADWLDKLQYVDFINDIGRHFTINRMLSFDSVRLRLEREQPLTFLEFNYMILQAWDFVELNRTHGCTLQMGGSDQWGNIVNGVELGRKLGAGDLVGLTTPLITTASGAKMGKTAAGAVWLNADMLSPWDYWQFWRNTDDADVGRFLRIFTDLPLAEIERLEGLPGAEINKAKEILATEATKLCHGADAASRALATAASTFSATSGAVGACDGNSLPTYEIKGDNAVSIIDVIVGLGFAASRSEARRLIEQGGVKLGDQTIGDITASISPQSTAPDGIKIIVGKKRVGIIR